jgi:hypothetical protein
LPTQVEPVQWFAVTHCAFDVQLVSQAVPLQT